MVVSFTPLKMFNGDGIWEWLYDKHYRSVHVDLGFSIDAEDDWYVIVPSYILKWLYKILTLNWFGW